MLKTRIILVAVSVVLIAGMFFLPKVVVENDAPLASGDSTSGRANSRSEPHMGVTPGTASAIKALRRQYAEGSGNEKNAIFADSLATMYREAGKFDSAAWFSAEAATFFNTTASRIKAGDQYYEAYTYAVDAGKQKLMAEKAQEFYKAVLAKEPKHLDAKTKLAMTYMSSAPMQGVNLLREVLVEDPKNELALYNLGMLSVQSRQFDKAVPRLEELLKVNPDHIQGRLLLGIALMNTGDKKGAREQFEKVKKMDDDPAVQGIVDDYLKDLK